MLPMAWKNTCLLAFITQLASEHQLSSPLPPVNSWANTPQILKVLQPTFFWQKLYFFYGKHSGWVAVIPWLFQIQQRVLQLTFFLSGMPLRLLTMCVLIPCDVEVMEKTGFAMFYLMYVVNVLLAYYSTWVTWCQLSVSKLKLFGPD